MRGYAVVNYNITDYDREVYKNKEIKKIISFCLINGQDALCGSGDAGVNINGKNIDLTPYILKSLESVEMGIANPLFINKE
ncbi:hypothetical protein GJV78_20295 [Escherichia alba]|uniref:Uncharacterized protein n=1 Tax=Intestinirhabdus alba TaxID=2899544 RepID=A0A6L6IT36_9ENTR|nr:hypothetical protein [Intestinirhabdus alba]